MMTRKIITASWTVPLYALLLSIVEFSQQTLVETLFLESVSGFLLLCTIYMAYSFPIILTYGVVTSWFSDWVAKRFSSEHIQLFTSLVLHILFGLVLSWLSLLAAILFFLIDRRLMNRGDVTKRAAIKKLFVPIGCLLVMMGSVYLIGIVQDFFVRFNSI
ncbi:hypothetical protein [Exiguobacterium aestuarii]|uniref:hypothetical protein n=1 Tax=Exiguobacterium aestuarii TaxID=273527 RepID=UPI001CD54F92|nr:hypothetical protein [Exiguobacterium aestuarii]MCA0981591.1 hypothetical protein [Exiguobacterium aestuarii]